MADRADHLDRRIGESDRRRPSVCNDSSIAQVSDRRYAELMERFGGRGVAGRRAVDSIVPVSGAVSESPADQTDVSTPARSAKPINGE